MVAGHAGGREGVELKSDGSIFARFPSDEDGLVERMVGTVREDFPGRARFTRRYGEQFTILLQKAYFRRTRARRDLC